MAGGRRTGRETFYEVHRRHRRAGWRFSALSAVAVVLLGLPLSVIVSPFVTAFGLIALDVVNLVAPMPDLAAEVGRFLARLSNGGTSGGAPPAVTVTETVAATVALLVPGMALMAVSWLGVRRLFMRSAAGAVVLAAGARPPARDDVEERQLVNLVEEMAIAAGVPPPRVMVLDAQIVNAAVVGRSIDDVTLIVPRSVLEDLGRAPTGALVASLLASVVNGDLRAALVIASVYQTFDLIGAVLGAPGSRRTRRALWRSARLALRRRPHGDGTEEHHIADELADVAALGDEEQSGGLLTLPFLVASIAYAMTRLLIGGPLVGLVLAALWRRRRLLADATAVELTRDPDALAQAIQYLEQRATVVSAGPWTHLFAVGPEIGGAAVRRRMSASREAQTDHQRALDESGATSSSFMAMSLDSFLPRPDVRLRRLAAMGARIDVPASLSPSAVNRHAPVSGGKRLAIEVVGWIAGIALGAFLLLCGVILLALLASLIYLALAFQLLLLLPLVAGARFLLRDIVAAR